MSCYGGYGFKLGLHRSPTSLPCHIYSTVRVSVVRFGSYFGTPDKGLQKRIDLKLSISIDIGDWSLVSRSLSIGIYIEYWSPRKPGIWGSKTVGSRKFRSPKSKAFSVLND